MASGIYIKGLNSSSARLCSAVYVTQSETLRANTVLDDTSPGHFYIRKVTILSGIASCRGSCLANILHLKKERERDREKSPQSMVEWSHRCVSRPSVGLFEQDLHQ